MSLERLERAFVCIIAIFERVRGANLVLRPSKYESGNPWIDIMGHRVGKNKLESSPDLISKILSAGRPLARKLLQSF